VAVFPTAIEGGEALGELEEGPQVLARPGLWGWLAAHPTIAYIVRRILVYIFTLWAAITATFFFFRLIPGDPISAYIQSLRSNYAENASTSSAVINHYKAIFGLDGSLLSQYSHFMRQLIGHGNWGPSLISYPRPAQSIVASALPWTIGLLLTATAIGWILGTLFGALAGWRRGGRLSEAATWLSVAFGQVPFYLIGIVLVFLLSFTWHIFPATHPYSVNVNPGFSFSFIASVIHYGILPAGSIVLVATLGNLLSMRQQMITVVGEDYLSFAQAKGLRPRRMLTRYAMPNCYLPQVTNLTISLGFIFGGNVIVEELFQYPGVGYILVKAIGVFDLNTVMCVTDISIFAVLTAVLLLDLIMPLLDPRIKYSRAR
jgi:peptide/nickel transport system permease protein